MEDGVDVCKVMFAVRGRVDLRFHWRVDELINKFITVVELMKSYSF